MAELLGVRVLQRLDGHRGLGSCFPLGAALVHHGGLHRHQVGAEDGEAQQELCAEVVVVRLYALLDLIAFRIQRNLSGKRREGETLQSTDASSCVKYKYTMCRYNQSCAYFVFRSCLALENRGNTEADRLDLPEASQGGTVLHHPLHLQSQLLTVLHWDRLAGCSR